MSEQIITVHKMGNVCDICGEPIEPTLRLYWTDSGRLERRMFFRFKTMYAGKTGTAYDAHGQCAANVLTDFIQNKERAKVTS